MACISAQALLRIEDVAVRGQGCSKGIEGLIVRGGYSSQDLTTARIVKIDLVVLLESAKAGSRFGDVEVRGSGGRHGGVRNAICMLYGGCLNRQS